MFLFTRMLLYVHLFIGTWVHNVNVLHVAVKMHYIILIWSRLYCLICCFGFPLNFCTEHWPVYFLYLCRPLINVSLKIGTCWSDRPLSMKLFEVMEAQTFKNVWMKLNFMAWPKMSSFSMILISWMHIWKWRLWPWSITNIKLQYTTLRRLLILPSHFHLSREFLLQSIRLWPYLQWWTCVLSDFEGQHISMHAIANIAS